MSFNKSLYFLGNLTLQNLISNSQNIIIIIITIIFINVHFVIDI